MSEATSSVAVDFGTDHSNNAESPLWAIAVLAALLIAAVFIFKGKN